jgi:4-diphosphocytidyl-2-C-methyl-D-erythritol kinase
MIVFPHCKINLGLHILDKRSDGYHNLQTVFYPVPFCDALEIIQEPDYSAKANTFTQTGQILDVAAGQNICEKAWALFKKDFPELPYVQMHLHKAIPSGAGLGGGSADGAFTLLLLNQKFNLGLSQTALIQYALALGSDCPFFIMKQPCFATGRGESLQPISLSLKGYTLVLVNPSIHISTGWAFAQLPPRRPQQDILKILEHPVQEWQNQIVNDFEEPIGKHYPQIISIKKWLLEAGAVYASMSGSGSTVFGLFEPGHSKLTSYPPNLFVKTIPLV